MKRILNGVVLDVLQEEEEQFATVTPVPMSITPRQGELTLSRAGLLSSVKQALESLEGQAGEESRIEYARAQEWRRDWPLLLALASGLGLTSEQIDQLFITAAQL